MFEQNPITHILLENCKSFSERRELFALSEADMNSVNNNMVSRLFKSAIEKSHIDYDDIPKSKGDITKYDGYKSMVESLGLLRQIALKSSYKIPEIDIVERALDNIVGYRNLFERGIKLNKDYVVLQYNTLVMSCVIATSSLISSYVDFIKKIDTIEFTITNPKSNPGKICIDNLAKFNKSVASGDFSKVMNNVITNDSKPVNESVTVIAATVIMGAILGVTFMRDIVFYVYYSRVKIAEYLRVQALFLELNKNTINSNSYNASADKKEKIIKKQSELITKLKSIADKIDVSDRLATNNMKVEIKKENSGWKLDDVKSDIASKDSNGFQLI